MDEELNLLSYLRYLRRWRFTQIQKSYFPLLSPSALLGAYWRLSTEDRVRRASAVAAPITTSRNTARDTGSTNAHQSISCLFSQSESSTETSIPPLQSSVTRNKSIAESSKRNRYNLRPNRHTIFLQRKPRYQIDRRRFPHFSKSYRYHTSRHGLPDRDYVPLSHTPTPELSDRSPSVISSHPSLPSSLELFGLETRSLNSSQRGSSGTPGLSDVSSVDFFSSEEHPPTS